MKLQFDFGLLDKVNYSRFQLVSYRRMYVTVVLQRSVRVLQASRPGTT